MAQMIPHEIADDTKSYAEKELFHRLKKDLDDSYIVFHSYDILAKNLENKIVDAEIDFLVFSSTTGCLILEAKGGSVRFDGNSGQWFQNSIPMKKSPFEQAKSNKYIIQDYLKTRLGHRISLPLGHAVCFPDVFTEIGELSPDADKDLLITGHQIPYLKEAIPSIMERFRKEPTQGYDKDEIIKVRKALMPVFEYGISLKDTIGTGEEIIFRLTDEQCDMLDMLQEHKRVLVKGCAGSGKTIMAVKKAKELASQGMSVLLLCYNLLLGKYLAESTKDVSNITAMPYNDFCIKELKNGGIPVTKNPDEQFWNTGLPNMFLDYLTEHPKKYDAIIVDEAQDFLKDYWIIIEEMLAKDGYFYIFHDPDQNIFGKDMDFPIKDQPFVLSTNCRNTLSICEELKKYTSHMEPKKGLPEGRRVERIPCYSDADMRKHLAGILHNLVSVEKIDNSKIVILGAYHSIQDTFLKDGSNLGNLRIIDSDIQGIHNGILYHSYRRFKGCETDIVILLDVDPKDQKWSKQAIYTAMSRAKFMLYILERLSP